MWARLVGDVKTRKMLCFAVEDYAKILEILESHSDLYDYFRINKGEDVVCVFESDSFLDDLKRSEERREKEVVFRKAKEDKKKKLREQMRLLRIAKKKELGFGQPFCYYNIPGLDITECNGGKCRRVLDTSGSKSGEIHCTSCYGSDFDDSDVSDYEFDEADLKLIAQEEAASKASSRTSPSQAETAGLT